MSGGAEPITLTPDTGTPPPGAPPASESVTPASSPEPAGDSPLPDSPATSPGEGGSSQAAEATAPAVEPPPDDDHRVPWPKFREVQTQLTRTTENFRTERQKLAAQIQQMEQEMNDLRRIRSDHELLSELLDENPELANQLYEQAGQDRPARRPAGAAARTERTEEPPPWVKPLLDDIALLKQDRITSTMTAKQRAEAERDQQTLQELDGILTKELARRRLRPDWLGHARSFVLDRVARMENASMEDVPPLFSEWYKPFAQALQSQYEDWRGAKSMAAQETGPAAGSTPGRIETPPEYGAMDARTASILEEKLKQAGWS